MLPGVEELLLPTLPAVPVGAELFGVVLFGVVLGEVPAALPAVVPVAPAFPPIAPGVPLPALPAIVRLSTTLRLPENDSAILRAMSLSRCPGTEPPICTAWSVTFKLMLECARFGSFLYAVMIWFFTSSELCSAGTAGFPLAVVPFACTPALAPAP